MSKLNNGLYSSEDHTWMTPPELVEALLKFEGRDQFDLDAATTEFNIPAHSYYTDGMLYERTEWVWPWPGIDKTCGLTGNRDLWGPDRENLIFLNPPYGNKLKLFMEKAHKEAQKGCRIWALVPARTETRYQHDFGLTKAGFTVFLKGRLEFLQNGEKKGTAPFPTMLLYFGDDWQEKAERWSQEQPWPGTLMVTYGKGAA